MGYNPVQNAPIPSIFLLYSIFIAVHFHTLNIRKILFLYSTDSSFLPLPFHLTYAIMAIFTKISKGPYNLLKS